MNILYQVKTAKGKLKWWNSTIDGYVAAYDNLSVFRTSIHDTDRFVKGKFGLHNFEKYIGGLAEVMGGIVELTTACDTMNDDRVKEFKALSIKEPELGAKILKKWNIFYGFIRNVLPKINEAQAKFDGCLPLLDNPADHETLREKIFVTRKYVQEIIKEHRDLKRALRKIR